MQKAIYSIKDEKNKRVYIGETMNLTDRFINHKEELDNNTHINKRLQSEYNSEDFKFCIELLLDESICMTNEEFKMLLLMLERKTINKYKEVGYEVFNAEDSLQRVLQCDKKLFSDDTKEYSAEEIEELFIRVNSKLKTLKQIDTLLYETKLRLKDLYNKRELICAEVIARDTWRLNEEKAYYTLKSSFRIGIISGDDYDTYVINEELKAKIEKALDSYYAIYSLQYLM